ncbi:MULTISPECIES: phosphate acetyltransferase [unclassified Curtobacterium]|uniref:phosphate acetyltransferase n=1 Tax=unclassified Curtobacterium TaxID=257496 RepID=UPI000DA7AF2C|nr:MULTISPECIES: phosphate acetyltransferase [unclassified Curtobacterium]PZE26496.1 phosphate acetyltransferase [Curtobacterium sp. MCBD17_028]PZE74241.1 phosphate acetyltransferase [Curtobacterium sp. MCBD17_019]WIB66488.1 phosphate acetyltransferase [Curtobacterium sp. MCBD17_035]WIE53650.1 phosphate acetyltransferase [Curtobacterium sp. MCBD17_003]
MSTRIYITSAEGHTGKSTVALGVLETLARTVGRVGVFRPVARSTAERDYVLELLLQHTSAGIDYDDAVGVTYEDVHADPDGALATIVNRFALVERQCDAVVVVGSDYTDVGSPTELSYNARIAANLGAPVLLVLGGRSSSERGARTGDDVRQIAELTTSELRAAHASLLGVVANRTAPERIDEVVAGIRSAIATEHPGTPVWAIPEDAVLVAPTVRAVLAATDATLVSGDEALLDREALGTVVAAMSMENVLPRLIEGGIVVVPGDRTDVLIATLLANDSETFPSLAGVVLNGGFETSPQIQRLLEGLSSTLPIARNGLGTYDTALRITQTRGRLAADSPRKTDLALSLFERHVDADELLARLEVGPSSVVTPLMFEHGLIDRARELRKRIVLPEGDDDRILRAASTLLQRDVCDLTILGDPTAVRTRAAELGLDLDAADVVDPSAEPLRERFAEEYARVRAHKGMTVELARDRVTDVSYFGTLMVHLGLADGMVSGARHTTAHTIRPAFEIIKTRPDVSIVSSVFLMALADRVLVYGDCAVVPDPTSEQLADIATSSAATAAQFGIEPRVAMLSYSTGDSGSGADVDKVRAATAFVRERHPELLVEGPIQYDAAADPTVARAKMPDSPVAGRATVFIFPDLNTGNNTYKAVQRSAGAVAIGPVLQGLRKPINDLSRGALVGDIVNTVAITAIQAGTSAEPRKQAS